MWLHYVNECIDTPIAIPFRVLKRTAGREENNGNREAHVSSVGVCTQGCQNRGVEVVESALYGTYVLFLTRNALFIHSPVYDQNAAQ